MLMIPEADKEAAFCLAERLREKFAGIKLKNLPKITISLGIATFPYDGTQIDDLIKKADTAMYAAKQAGRNRVVKYTRNLKLSREKTISN